MSNYRIKTRKIDAIYPGSKIYILNKGLNSGKPQKEPFTNSFVILFTCEEEAETVYWLAYSLWKSNFWHQHLIGSVIPFIRLRDFQKEFDNKVVEMLADFELHQKQVKALKLLEEKEAQFHQNLKLINDMRRVILYRYCNKAI
jgi:hypothetical protein